MTKLLTQQEEREEIVRICDEEFGVGNTPNWLMMDLFNFMKRQKQAHADMVIGEDEAVQYIDDQPATELDEYAEYRNGLRHNQRLRNTL